MQQLIQDLRYVMEPLELNEAEAAIIAEAMFVLGLEEFEDLFLFDDDVLLSLLGEDIKARVAARKREKEARERLDKAQAQAQAHLKGVGKTAAGLEVAQAAHEKERASKRYTAVRRERRLRLVKAVAKGIAKRHAEDPRFMEKIIAGRIKRFHGISEPKRSKATGAAAGGVQAKIPKEVPAKASKKTVSDRPKGHSATFSPLQRI